MEKKSGVNRKNDIVGLIWLLIALIYFTGVFAGLPGFWQVFDLQVLIGKFGVIGNAVEAGIEGVGGYGASDALFQAVSMLPAVMVALALLTLVDNYGGMRMAQKLLTPVLKFLLGVSGKSAAVIITNWQSSDASAAASCELWESGQITARERDILVAYCFVSAATIGMYFSNGAMLFPYLTTKIGVGLGVIMVMKIVAANLMRLYNRLFEKELPAFVTADAATDAASAASGKRTGLIETFLEGCRKGIRMWSMSILPGTVLGFVVIQILKTTGLMQVLSVIFTPVMQLMGLPGEAISVWITSFLALSGGCAAAVSLVADGVLTARHITILLPMIFCVTNQVPFIGRVLSVSKISSKKYVLVMAIGIFTSFLAGAIMNVLA